MALRLREYMLRTCCSRLTRSEPKQGVPSEQTSTSSAGRQPIRTVQERGTGTDATGSEADNSCARSFRAELLSGWRGDHPGVAINADDARTPWIDAGSDAGQSRYNTRHASREDRSASQSRRNAGCRRRWSWSRGQGRGLRDPRTENVDAAAFPVHPLFARSGAAAHPIIALTLIVRPVDSNACPGAAGPASRHQAYADDAEERSSTCSFGGRSRAAHATTQHRSIQLIGVGFQGREAKSAQCSQAGCNERLGEAFTWTTPFSFAFDFSPSDFSPACYRGCDCTRINDSHDTSSAEQSRRVIQCAQSGRLR